MTTDQDSNEVPLFEKPPSYRSYVLRLWQERGGQSPLDVWRFSLEDPQTDQRHGFADLEALTAWLIAEMARMQETGGDSG